MIELWGEEDVYYTRREKKCLGKFDGMLLFGDSCFLYKKETEAESLDIMLELLNLRVASLKKKERAKSD